MPLAASTDPAPEARPPPFFPPPMATLRRLQARGHFVKFLPLVARLVIVTNGSISIGSFSPLFFSLLIDYSRPGGQTAGLSSPLFFFPFISEKKIYGLPFQFPRPPNGSDFPLSLLPGLSEPDFPHARVAERHPTFSFFLFFFPFPPSRAKARPFFFCWAQGKIWDRIKAFPFFFL